eukprot:1180300-Prorocentrum_minimum.AAC.1
MQLFGMFVVLGWLFVMELSEETHQAGLTRLPHHSGRRISGGGSSIGTTNDTKWMGSDEKKPVNQKLKYTPHDAQQCYAQATSPCSCTQADRLAAVSPVRARVSRQGPPWGGGVIGGV